MSMKSLPNTFENWINTHQEISQFLSYAVIPDPDEAEMAIEKDKIINSTRSKEISKMKEFLDKKIEELSQKRKHKVKVKKPPFQDVIEKKKIFNILRFVYREFSHMQEKYFLSIKKSIQSLISLLRNKVLLSNIDLIIKTEFYTVYLKEPTELEHLFYAKEYYENLYINFDKTHNIQKHKMSNNPLKKIVDAMNSNNNNKIVYYPEDENQYAYENILSDTKFKYVHEIIKFITSFSTKSRADFMIELLTLSDSICSAYEIKDQLSIIYSYSFFSRFIFKITYSYSPKYFFPNYLENNSQIPKYSHRVVCSHVDIPGELLGPHEPSDKLIDVMGRNPFYKEAAEHILMACFYSNPLGALNEIHLAIECNEKGAFEQIQDEKAPMFPFETTFGLFVGSIFLSETPNFEEMIQFIIDFTPKSAINADFEFALTISRAALEFCTELINEISKDNTE